MHTLVEPSFWTMFMVQYLAIDGKLAKKLWRCLAQHSNAQAVIFAWLRLPASVDPYQAFDHLLDGPMAPHRLFPIIEDLVMAGELTRLEASSVEDAILQQTTREGAWQ